MPGAVTKMLPSSDEEGWRAERRGGADLPCQNLVRGRLCRALSRKCSPPQMRRGGAPSAGVVLIYHVKTWSEGGCAGRCADWAHYFEITALAPLGERGNRKAVGEGVSTDMNALGQFGIRPYGLDPLTRPAPADESAGSGPPSPPRGRGK